MDRVRNASFCISMSSPGPSELPLGEGLDLVRRMLMDNQSRKEINTPGN